MTIDENGVGDESVYTDSNCDPRFSSCDTDSNSLYSNTDSVTVETVSSKSTIKPRPPIKGSLAFHYGKKYGVVVHSDTEGDSSCHGYDCPHVHCLDRSCNTDSDTQVKTINGGYTTVDFTSYKPDSCDESDPGCAAEKAKKHERVEPESYSSSSETSSETELPSTGTSRSSNSTGEHHSDSKSGNDSSSDDSDDTESDNSSLSEDLCANVIIRPQNPEDDL